MKHFILKINAKFLTILQKIEYFLKEIIKMIGLN